MTSRRMTVLAALVVGLGASLAVPAAASAPPLKTPFEASNGKAWTTLPEEAAFLGKVAAGSRRVKIDQIGSTVQGRPLQLVQIAEPGPRPAPAVAAGSVVLFICSQHGDEPAGREGCLSRIRDLAFSRDAEIVRMLRSTTVLFLPTANPDGRVADTRGNADGVDINRDHIALATPEARAMAKVFKDYKPDVVHDLHEYGTTPPYYNKDVTWLWPRNLNVADRVHDESEKLSRDYAKVAVESAGHTSGVYGIWTDPNTGEPIKQTAGDGQERILRNTSGLKHAVGMLLESAVDPKNDAEKADPVLNARRRVHSHLVSVNGTLKMARERRAQIELATTLSRNLEPFKRKPIYFGGADNQPAKPEEVLSTPPCGYRLTAPQFQQVRQTLELHDVHSWSVGDAPFVPLAQQARGLIPLLLDAKGQYRITTAERVGTC
ncbi:M14 family metallocarboxypeptidase [Allokutzneria sp. A3M-2-11 16]|uniref:M14 family metallopeptidase n=1 Tax=Allokutzneria sp. A3M-2-11 16 TaxID=2962043 RepID=UPI0020B6DC22|nr:M14 family metallocarboxypeptidase [Allokutzneria sp. A3M-2-11 16]MCP3801133.1 M14 family metallocarboxypeptidase [Allokutzneria sp. A3M-2-11 16]